MNKPLECHVRLWGEDVGTVAQIGSKIYFQYENTFLGKNIEISPLYLPLGKKVYETTHLDYFDGLAGVFADALPDSWGGKIIENYFLNHQNLCAYEVSSVQKLLYMGSRGVGALEFLPAGDAQQVAMRQILEISELVKQSRKVLRGDVTELLPDLFRISSDSLGGAKAKANVGLNLQTHELITSGGQLPEGFDYWMIKFDGTDEKSTPSHTLLSEKIYLDMAKMCGIRSVETTVIKDGELSHLAVKRFDRMGNEKPLHTHTLAGMSHMNFKDKQTMSYELFFRTILAVTKDYGALEEGYRRMVFNVLSGNQDDHAKNHSFVMDREGKWDLSPAYDISPAFGYGHQMAINFKDKGVNQDDLLVMAKRFDIKNAKEIVEQQTQVLQGFETYAKALDLPQNQIADIVRNMKVPKP